MRRSRTVLGLGAMALTDEFTRQCTAVHDHYKVQTATLYGELRGTPLPVHLPGDGTFGRFVGVDLAVAKGDKTAYVFARKEADGSFTILGCGVSKMAEPAIVDWAQPV